MRTLLLSFLTFASLSFSQPAGWLDPFPPHKIADNFYYVGTKELATFLITTPQGLILMNSNYEASVPIIKANVEKLGFKFSDVKVLIAGHAHPDHVEGDALVKEMTGARVVVGELEVERTKEFKPKGKEHPIDQTIDDGETFTAKRVLVSVPWWTVLRRTLVIDRIHVTGLDLFIDSYPKDVNNIPRLSRPSSGRKLPFTTVISQVVLDASEFTFRDNDSRWMAVCRNLNLVVVRALGALVPRIPRYADYQRRFEAASAAEFQTPQRVLQYAVADGSRTYDEGTIRHGLPDCGELSCALEYGLRVHRGARFPKRYFVGVHQAQFRETEVAHRSCGGANIQRIARRDQDHFESARGLRHWRCDERHPAHR